MNELLIRTVLLFAPLWRGLGADDAQLRAILTAKLLTDDRRPTNLALASGGDSGWEYQQYFVLFFFMLMGAFALLFPGLLDDRAGGFALYLLIFVILLASIVISDFTEVLIDVRDNHILFSRPVNDATITLSRLLHILLYLSRLVLAFMIPALVFLFVQRLWLGIPLFLLQMLLTTVLIVFLINLLYLLILQRTTSRQFKAVIGYVQLAFSTLLFGFFLLLPEVIRADNLLGGNALTHPLTAWLPTTWIASLWATVIEGRLTLYHGLLNVLGLLTPVLCVWVVIRYLARDLGRKLSSLAEGGVPVSRLGKGGRSRWFRQVSRRFTWGSTERAGFDLGWQLTGRMRTYKLRVYPTLALVPVYFIWFGMQESGSVSERLQGLAESEAYFFLIYLGLFLIHQPWYFTFYSERHAAAWIFYARPVHRPGELLAGVLKAVALRFFLPFYLLLFLLALITWGPHVADDFLLGLCNLGLITLAGGSAAYRSMPFSKPMPESGGGEQIILSFILVGAIALTGWLHYLASGYPLILWGWMMVAAAGLTLIYYLFRRISWREVV